MQTQPEHEVLYQDLVALMRKHEHLGGAVMLAVAANMLGKLVAIQDQRQLTPELAMRIVSVNIEIGNKQVIDSLANAAPGGTKN